MVDKSCLKCGNYYKQTPCDMCRKSLSSIYWRSRNWKDKLRIKIREIAEWLGEELS